MGFMDKLKTKFTQNKETKKVSEKYKEGMKKVEILFPVRLTT